MTFNNKLSKYPAWIDTYPADNAYFIGIGSSNTGNESEDRKIAEDRARSNIASSISVSIKSETELVTKEDSNGFTYEYVEDKIKSSVEENLKGIETIDTYHSEDSGTWVYMKLSKAVWQKNKLDEMDSINTRISDLLEPSINDINTPLSTKLQNLKIARDIVVSSPYSGILKTSLFGRHGLAISLVDSRIQELMDSTSFKVTVKDGDLEVGEYLFVDLKVETELSTIKNLPFKIVDENSRVIYSSVISGNENLRYKINPIKLKSGINKLLVVIDTDQLGFDNTTDIYNYPNGSFNVNLQTMAIGLRIESSSKNLLDNSLKSSIKSLFTLHGSPFVIHSESNPYINFNISVTDIPRIDADSPDIAIAKSTISIIQNSKVIYTAESDPFKAGGLNKEQAYQRATSKLITKLQSDNNLIEGMIHAIASN